MKTPGLKTALEALKYARVVARSLYPSNNFGLQEDLAQVGVIEWLRNQSDEAIGLRMRNKMIDSLRSWEGRKSSHSPHKRLQYTSKMLPWDLPIGEDGLTLGDSIQDPRSTEDAGIARATLSAIDALPARERDCVLVKIRGHWREVAQQYGITESRISQIRTETLRKIA